MVTLEQWLDSELALARKAFTRAERDKCWADTGSLSGRISAIRDVQEFLRKEASRASTTHGVSQP